MMNENIYLGKNLKTKTVFFAITGFIDTVLCFSSLVIFPLTLIDYSSAALGFFLCLTIAFGLLMVLRVRNVILIGAARHFSEQFIKATEPFITISELPTPVMRKWKSNYMAR